MNRVKQEIFNREIKNQEYFDFDIDKEGLYLIYVLAKCKNWTQNYRRLFNDDDLAIEIDNFPFFEFKGKQKEFDSPASWNGNEIKNSSKIVFFILPLTAGKHNIKFYTDGAPFLEKIKIFKPALGNEKVLKFETDLLPISENGKLFFDIAVKNIFLNNLKITAKANLKDKLSVKINDKIIENSNSKKYKIWYWLGSQLRGQGKDLTQNLSSYNNLNYFEFRGVNNPAVENIEFNFEDFDLNRWGKISIYPDIEISDFANLRTEPDDKSDLVVQIKNGEKVKILEEVVIGKYVDFKSYVWHKIRYKNYEGFVLSSYVEIEGQERDRIISIIKNKAKENGIDEGIVLALAGCESKYKVYACSYKDARGIFQITEKLQEDLNDPIKSFYSPAQDLFDFEKNIAGGIKYFAYLYNGKYKKCKDKLIRTVAAYNTGPGDVPAEGKLNLKLYQDETQQLTVCVPRVYSSRKWYEIPTINLPVILLIALSVCGLIYWDNWKSNTYYTYTANINFIKKAEKSDDEINKYAIQYEKELEEKQKVSWDENTDQILFFDNNGNILYKMSTKNLKIDGDGRIHAEKLTEKNNKIYFSATNSCGSAGCSDTVYEFDLSSKKLRVIKSIFGMRDLFISPNGLKAALIYGAGSGNGCGDFSFEIIDLDTLVQKKINGFVDKLHEDQGLKSLSWKDNNKIEFEVVQWSCGVSPYRFLRTFNYNLDSGGIIMEKEKVQEGAG